MSKHYAITLAAVIVGVAMSAKKAEAAAGEGGIAALDATSLLDKFDKGQLAVLMYQAEARAADDFDASQDPDIIADAARKLHGEQPNKFKKTSAADLADKVWAALEAVKWPKIAGGASAGGEGKLSGTRVRAPGGVSVKQHLRNKFPKPNKSKRFTLEELCAIPDHADQQYNPVSITTAISDLKSEKYCGEGGPVVIERTRENDVNYYTRVA